MRIIPFIYNGTGTGLDPEIQILVLQAIHLVTLGHLLKFITFRFLNCDMGIVSIQNRVVKLSPNVNEVRVPKQLFQVWARRRHSPEFAPCLPCF